MALIGLRYAGSDDKMYVNPDHIIYVEGVDRNVLGDFGEHMRLKYTEVHMIDKTFHVQEAPEQIIELIKGE